MGMADPRDWRYRMTCCGFPCGWQSPKPDGRWGGNTWYEVEKCPNPACHTHKAEAVRRVLDTLLNEEAV